MIAPEGWPFFTVPVFLGLAAVVLGMQVSGWVLVVAGASALIVFRDPPRLCVAPPQVVCSPIDGRVVAVGPSPPGDADLGKPVEIRLLTSVLSVLVSRVPVDGRLVDDRSLEIPPAPGEHVSVWETEWGYLSVHQVTRGPGRRVTFELPPGIRASRSTRSGHSRFRTSTRVVLPATADILARPGQRVRGGETPIASLAPVEPIIGRTE